MFDGTNWKWVSGTNQTKQVAKGEKNILASTNQISARCSSAMWIDSHEVIWIFGGAVSQTDGGLLSDLWSFDVNSRVWNWVAGPKRINQDSKFSPLNPGATQQLQYWLSSENDDALWMFGGYGYYESGPQKQNVAFKFWSGFWTLAELRSQITGDWGTKGFPSQSNYPPATNVASFWRASNGDFWMFGGQSYNSSSMSNSRGIFHLVFTT